LAAKPIPNKTTSAWMANCCKARAFQLTSRFNKPKGYVTTVSDEKKRPTVMIWVQKVKGRVYPVGTVSIGLAKA